MRYTVSEVVEVLTVKVCVVLNTCTLSNILTAKDIGDKGRLPLVRTGRSDQSICKENATINKNCPNRSVHFYTVCITGRFF